MGSERTFVTGQFYHVYNRGVAKQTIFQNRNDFTRFLTTLSFYLEDPPFSSLSVAKNQPERLAEYLKSLAAKPIVRIHAYCLMPNHFHLLVEQTMDHGLTQFLRLSQLSYTRAYNQLYDRVGPLFQGTFQAVRVTNDEHLLQVSRYIHLNPFVAKLASHPKEYPWSSLAGYVVGHITRLYTTEFITALAGNSEQYLKFVTDYASYAQDLHAIKEILIDI